MPEQTELDGWEQSPILTREDRERFYSWVILGVYQKTQNRIKACELLGKMNGDFVAKSEIKHSGSVESKYSAYTEEELRRVIDEGEQGRASLDISA